MPNTEQAKKRLRQGAKRNLRNRMVKSEIRSYTKKVLTATEAKDGTTAKETLQVTQAKLDKAAKKGVLHKNTVARRKSQLAKKVAQLG